MADWPVLIVTLAGAVELRSNGLLAAHIEGAVSAPDPAGEDRAVTRVEGDGGTVEVVHHQLVEVRCFDRDGSPLIIPFDVEDRDPAPSSG